MANVKHENLTEAEMKSLVARILNDTERFFTKLDVRHNGNGYKVIATTYPINNED